MFEKAPLTFERLDDLDDQRILFTGSYSRSTQLAWRVNQQPGSVRDMVHLGTLLPRVGHRSNDSLEQCGFGCSAASAKCRGTEVVSKSKDT